MIRFSTSRPCRQGSVCSDPHADLYSSCPQVESTFCSPTVGSRQRQPEPKTWTLLLGRTLSIPTSRVSSWTTLSMPSDWPDLTDTFPFRTSATFLCARQAFRIMKQQQGGRIIINGSISAHVPRPDSVACESGRQHPLRE